MISRRRLLEGAAVGAVFAGSGLSLDLRALSAAPLDLPSGLPSGTRAEAVLETLDADPVSSGIFALMNTLTENGEVEFWRGTSTELLKTLESATDEATKRSRAWPR